MLIVRRCLATSYQRLANGRCPLVISLSLSVCLWMSTPPSLHGQAVSGRSVAIRQSGKVRLADRLNFIYVANAGDGPPAPRLAATHRHLANLCPETPQLRHLLTPSYAAVCELCISAHHDELSRYRNRTMLPQDRIRKCIRRDSISISWVKLWVCSAWHLPL